MKAFIDIETKGLHGDFLVGTIYDQQTDELLSYADLTEFLFVLKSYKQIIAHNSAYEYVCLRNYGYDVDQHEWLCSMTLAHCVSKEFAEYSLEFLSVELNLAERKIYHEDFSTYSPELLERNRSDVRIMVALVKRLLNIHANRFGKDPRKQIYIDRLIATWKQRTLLANTAGKMSHFGIHLNVSLLNELEAETKDFIDNNVTKYVLPVYKKGKIVVLPQIKGRHAHRWYLDYNMVSCGSDNSVAYERCPIERKHLSSSTASNEKLMLKDFIPELIKASGNIDSKALDAAILLETDYCDLETKEEKSHKIINPSYYKAVQDYYIGYNLKGILTSIESYRKLLDINECVHSYFNPVGTRTGRFSSSKPNVQNVGGSRTTGYKLIDTLLKRQRGFVSARHGYVMLGADFDKIELVILGYLLKQFGDSKLLDAANEGQDIHAVNAAAWNCSRLDAKRGVFSIVYGATEYKLQFILNCSLEQAKNFIKKVNSGMPAISKAKEHYVKCCQKYGGVWDLAGNFYDYSDINATDIKSRSRCERQLFNAVIQGTCASLVAYMTPQVQAICEQHGGSLTGVIHDEYLAEIPVDKGETCRLLLNELMNKRTDIPFLPGAVVNADWFLGKSWSDVK